MMTYQPSSRRSWYALTVADGGAAEVYLYDEIGMYGVTAKQFIEDVSSAGGVQSLTVRINSPGGDVFAGLAIYNFLTRYQKPVTVVVDGMAASIASIIAMAGSERVMPENAFLFIHNPWTVTAGNSDDLAKEADALSKMQGALVGIYATRTGQSIEKVQELMDSETWLSATECLALGFATRVDAAHEMAAKFDCSLYRHIPCEVAAKFTKEKPMADEQTIAVEPAQVVPPVVAEPVAVDDRAGFADYASAVGCEPSACAHLYLAGKSVDEAKAELAKPKPEPVKPAPFAPVQQDNAPKSWKSALAECGNDYVKARKKYKALYTEYMQSTK